MKSLIWILVTVSLCTNCFAAESPQPITIPIQLVNNFPVIRASINGRPVVLYIDTGGHSELSLKPSSIPASAMSLDGSFERYVGADGVVRNARRFGIQDVQIGGLPIGELRGSALLNGPSGLDGYLGYGWLSRYIAVLDYPGGQIRLYEERNTVPDSECPGPWTDLGGEGSVATSTLETANGPITLAWDSGATENVLRRVPHGVQKKLGTWPWSPREAKIEASLGVTHLGIIEFKSISFQEPNVDGFLGYGFLKNHVVCMDFPNRKVTVGAKAP